MFPGTNMLAHAWAEYGMDATPRCPCWTRPRTALGSAGVAGRTEPSLRVRWDGSAQFRSYGRGAGERLHYTAPLTRRNVEAVGRNLRKLSNEQRRRPSRERKE
jgi:hypothetical protein